MTKEVVIGSFVDGSYFFSAGESEPSGSIVREPHGGGWGDESSATAAALSTPPLVGPRCGCEGCDHPAVWIELTVVSCDECHGAGCEPVKGCFVHAKETDR